MNPDPDPELIRIKGFDGQKLKKKNTNENLFCQKVVQSTEEAFSPQKRTSSASKMIFINFFLCLWVIFALLDPDPDPDCESGFGYGSRNPIESGSNPDPKTVHSTGSDVTFLLLFRFDPGDAACDDTSVPRGDDHWRRSEPGIRPDLPSGGFWLSGHKRGHVTHPRAASFPTNATGRRQRSEL